MRTTTSTAYGEASPYDDFLEEEPDMADTPPPEDIAVETPPPPTLFERLMEAEREGVGLRDEILNWITPIANFEKSGARQVSTNVDWVQVLAIGLAITGYSHRFYALLPEADRKDLQRICALVLDPLQKEEKESNTPSNPWNLIRNNASLYANR